MIKTTALVIIAFGVLGGLLLLGAPHIRSQQHDTIVTITAKTTSYECAGEYCIGFIADSIEPTSLREYERQLLLPYQENMSRDHLQEKLNDSLGAENTTACLKGQLHKYTVDTLRLTHPAAGGYKLELTSYGPGPC